MLIAPMGTGKTMSVDLLASRIVAEGGFREGARPVLHVVMPTVGTTDSIPTAILSALGGVFFIGTALLLRVGATDQFIALLPGRRPSTKKSTT